eukprot:1159845-Pelagomonas_calceolata.AAC.4
MAGFSRRFKAAAAESKLRLLLCAAAAAISCACRVGGINEGGRCERERDPAAPATLRCCGRH